MKTARLGIVILHYKTWEKNLACVESIYKNYSGEFQIVIVDNNSPNDSYNRLTQAFLDNPDVTVVKTERNGGFSYGNNFGFDYIVNNFYNISKIFITNNDIIFRERTIENMIGAFAFSEKVIMTAPSVFNIFGERTNAPWKKKPTVMQEIGLKSCDECAYKWDELKDNLSVYMISGCCFAVDRDKFISIGKFDENVFLYNEENIFSLKIARAGLQIIYCPNADILHDHGSTTGNRNVFVDREYVKSTLYFMKKYEKLSDGQIVLLKLFYVFRILSKKLFGKYSNSSHLFQSLKIIFSYKI